MVDTALSFYMVCVDLGFGGRITEGEADHHTVGGGEAEGGGEGLFVDHKPLHCVDTLRCTEKVGIFSGGAGVEVG